MDLALVVGRLCLASSRLASPRLASPRLASPCCAFPRLSGSRCPSKALDGVHAHELQLVLMPEGSGSAGEHVLRIYSRPNVEAPWEHSSAGERSMRRTSTERRQI